MDSPLEMYFAVLCEDVTPSTSMAHEEVWMGPFVKYETAQTVAQNELTRQSRFRSSHVCKRFVRAPQ